jgi:recombination protein RecA
MAGIDRQGGKAGDRDKALETALAQIERQFGRGSIMRLGDEARAPIEVIPSGAISLDVALGIGGFPRGRVVEIYGPEGSGKALALDTPIPTPKGWTTMGELSPGQEVFAGDGSPTRVTFATPVMTGHECFRVRFSDGAEVIADADHQWMTTTLSGRTDRWSPAVVTTRDIGATLWARDGFALNHAIEVCGPLEYPAQELLVAPYTLGAWLGDGTTDAASITTVDREVLDEIQRDGYTVHRNNAGQPDRAPRYRIAVVPERPGCLLAGPRCSAGGSVLARGLCANHYARERRNGRLSEWPLHRAVSLQAQLRELGVLGNKHIPERYLHASVAQRLALLQGIMDADGTVSAGGSGTGRGSGRAACEFSVVNERLAADAYELLLGLGIKATLRESPAVLHGRVTGTRYRIGFQTNLPVFRLPRKAMRLTPLRTRRAQLRYVAAVEPVASVPVRCIQVDHPSHTYLAGRECIPTHNTTVALHAVANAQKKGGIAAFIDAEHALDPEYAKNLGVDTDALLVSQPDTGEQALEIADMLIRSSAIDVIVIDSVAALVPRAEIEGEMGDSHVGLQARLMSQALRKLAGALNQTKTTAIFINQLREKVGVLFGSPETTSGGRALKFYASVRLDVRRIETLKDGTDAVGSRTKVKVVKNKCLAAGTRVFDPVTGLTHRIEEIVDGRLPIHAVSADKRGVLEAREVVSWFDQGDQEVVGIRLRDGTELWVTPDHKVLTEHGWRAAGELAAGDRVARPRAYSGFGTSEPVPPDHARLLGYLMGDGYVGGKTPVHFTNVAESLHKDAARIAGTLGCEAKLASREITVAFSHRPGEKNGVLELCRWAGIYGCLAPDKKIPPAFFAPDVSAEVVGNLIFGLFETDGYVSREQTGGLRAGFCTTSEQLGQQIHWLLLRWGIGNGVRQREPRAQRGGLINGRRISGKHPQWEVRVSGIENVSEFGVVIPSWGPRGQVLARELAKVDGRHRGSQRIYVADELVKPILGYLARRGVGPVEAAQLIGRQAPPGASLKAVLGSPRMRRDRLERLAGALDDSFLDDILADQLWFSRIARILPAQRRRTYDVEVKDLHNLVAGDVIVHNCAPPFRQAEFDILFGQGISREGGLIDLGVEHAIVRKSGAWYTYEGDQLGQGKENARSFLRDNPDLADEIEKKIKEKLGVGPRLDAEAADVEPASRGPAPATGLRVVPGSAPGAGAGLSGTRPAPRPGGNPGGAGGAG